MKNKDGSTFTQRVVRACMKFVLSMFSWAVAIYFIWVFHQSVGFPPAKPITATEWTYLVLFVFFAVLPFAQRLRIGRLIEFEAKVKEVQDEVREARTEARQLVATVSTIANTISTSVSQTINLNIPRAGEEKIAQDELSEIITDPPEPSAQRDAILSLVEAEGSDVHYALARLRIDLEQELRRLLGKRLEIEDPVSMRAEFLTARSLFRRLMKVDARYEGMKSSFDYMLRVCNAAIHGQRVPENIAYEAMDMGLRMLRELKKHQPV